MKIKTSELTGAALDWAVAQCEEHAWAVYDYAVYNEHAVTPPRPSEYLRDNSYGPEFSPTTSWAQGGPIVERECIDLMAFDAATDVPKNPEYWEATIYSKEFVTTLVGPTPLIAAMRCFVASKLGDEVEVPDELI